MRRNQSSIWDVWGFISWHSKEIFKKHNKLGEEELKNLKNNNLKQTRKKTLTDKLLEKLAYQLKIRSADGRIWTGLKVARWIEKDNYAEKIWDERGFDYL